MATPTVTFIIKKWLRNRITAGNYKVASHEIETDLVTYGKECWGKLHTPSTYSRAWRNFKNSNEIDDIDILSITPINNGRTETTWELKTIM